MEMLELEQVAKDEITSLTSGARGSIRLGLVSSSASPGLYRLKQAFIRHFQMYPLRFTKEIPLNFWICWKKAKLKWLSSEPLFPVTVWISPRFSMTTWSLPGLLNSLIPKVHLTVRDLTHHPLILYRRWSKTILNTFNREMLTPSIFCIADDARTCLQLAQAGMGVALVPSSIVSWGHGLTIRQLDELSWESRLVVVKRKSAPVSHKVEVFYNLLAENKGR